MRLLSPSRTRQLQRTLKNLRVSVLCFLLTFLVLRNTIGAGNFGTPAQDFEEIRQHLQHVSLPRKHARVLAEVANEEDPTLRTLEESHKNTRLWTTSHVKELPQDNVVPLKHPEASTVMDQDEPRRVEQGSYGDHNVLLVTGSTSPLCENPASERFLLKSVKNKLDYSRLHGFEAYYSNGSSHHRNSGLLSKASLLQALMREHPQVEWLWWVNTQVVITDMAFELPLLNYTGFNFVLLSADDAIAHQDSLINFNADSFLIRNCQWSIDLLQNWAQMASSINEDSDQLVELGTREVFVETIRALRGHWQHTVERFEMLAVEPKEGKFPFITHSMGCNPCGNAGDMEAEACLKHMEKVVDVIENQSVKMYGLQPRMSASS